MCDFTQDSWEMYRYPLEKQVFIIRERTGKYFPKYGAPGSILSGMVATSTACYDVVTFLTQRTYCSSNFVAISLLVLELLKKPRFW
jgi:hypothetical protein